MTAPTNKSQSLHLALVAAAASCALAATQTALGAGETITVTTLNDVVDLGVPQQAANLPGPDGRVSFREAVIAANNTAGPQTITFAIPQSEWWLVNNMAILKLETGAFIITDDETTVDFTTQMAFSGDTNPNGPEVGIFGLEANGWGTPAIIVDGSYCTIRGLGMVWQRGAGVAIWDGHDNRVVGCKTGSVEINGSFSGPPIYGNTIGGLRPGEGNELGSVSIICRANDNIVIGNKLRTVSVRGSSYCVRPERNRIGGPTPQERNVISGFGAFGEEGFPYGMGVEVSWAQDTMVEGNYIGVTADGMDRVPNWTSGVEVSDSFNTTIRNNLISGMWVAGTNHYSGQLFGQAIRVTSINGNTIGVTIEGNRIGTNATGQGAILTLNGVIVQPFTFNSQTRDVRIGGLAPGQGNLIAFTQRTGVVVAYPAFATMISGNSIHSNGLLGIDLLGFSGGAGVTPNDPGDGDTGGNNFQNFPVLNEVTSTASYTAIAGTLNSTPNTTFELQFFASPQADASLHGEGKLFLGSTSVTTNASGDAGFNAMLATAAPQGWFASATAIAPNGDTSEFAFVKQVSAGASMPGDVTGNGVVDVNDLLAVIGAWGPCPTPPQTCPADMAPPPNGDGVVNVNDLLLVIANWS